MKQMILAIAICCIMIIPVHAAEFTAPAVPESGEAFFPAKQETFGEGLWSIVKEGIGYIAPSLREAAATGLQIVGIALLLTIVKTVQGESGHTLELAATVAIAAVLLQPSNALIRMGSATIGQLCEYGRLLMPVLTAAMAAQGGVSTSTALYAGTIALDTVLGSLVDSLLIPMMYIFLCLSTASCATGERLLKKMKDSVKGTAVWLLKTILYIFTGYMGITGVVSGSADAAALKATKLTISGAVPVVGGILSDASEAILVGAGVMKSAAGVYGVLALLAIWIGPFIKIGVQYILLKGVCALTDLFDAKSANSLLQDFSSAMGLLLAMTGTVCLLLLISVVCFMKGIS